MDELPVAAGVLDRDHRYVALGGTTFTWKRPIQPKITAPVLCSALSFASREFDVPPFVEILLGVRSRVRLLNLD